ncbi:uncharacterized protein LOC110264437 [Arachis ipaensis]|uniref:uncharacterized protein LOC110264437 n=1 Tax=Arachis ipaensis TaxID=130454 RepID=UPI000A2B4570|nr:uncharacterized protein LOC110264437 [Arachis ipaensis]XP_029150495.1 uncharacterized protein LOC114925711 [Arachis hypogaea]
MEQSKKNNEINVPFSWESKPGLSRVSNSEKTMIRSSDLELKPPPPYRSSRVHPRISSFRMESTSHTHCNKGEDPFVEAYKKCTKTPPSSSTHRNKKKSSSSWPSSIIKYMHIFSCKLFAGDVVS